MAYGPRRHQGMTPWCRRSRNPRAFSPLDRQRRRMPTSATLRKDLISLQHVTPRASARGPICRNFVIIDFLSPHVFKRAFVYFPLPLLGFRMDPSLFKILLVKPFFFVNLIFYEHIRLLGCGQQVGPFPSRPIMGSIRGEGTPPPQTLAVI